MPLAACSVAAPDHGSGSADGALGRAQNAQTTLPARLMRTVPWGSGPAELRMRPRGFETLATGPDAVALTPGGDALVLDGLAGRVVQVGASGGPRTVASVASDAQDLAAAVDGSFAAFSPLQARAWIFQPDGTPAGELAVPRTLTMLQRLSLGPSHTVQAHDGYQQTMSLGSPSAPLPLPVVLRTVREGGAFLPDGRGLQCRVQDGVAELWVVEQSGPERERARVVARHALSKNASSARIVGAEGTLTCVRIETVTSTPEISVERRALCLDAPTGQILLDEPLGRPGLYAPRTELAMGGGRLGFIRPMAAGLELRSWRLGDAAASKEVTP
jgi:hypothetical protein